MLALIKQYKVGTLVIQNGSNALKIVGFINSRTDITIKEITAIAGSRIYVLIYGHSHEY